MSEISPSAQWAREQQDRGLCSRCSRPRMATASLCEGHLVRARMNQWAIQRPECKPYRPSSGKGRGGDPLFELAVQALKRLHDAGNRCEVSGKTIELGLNAEIDHIISVPDSPELAYLITNLRWVDKLVNKQLNRGKGVSARKSPEQNLALALRRLQDQSSSWHLSDPELSDICDQIYPLISRYVNLAKDL